MGAEAREQILRECSGVAQRRTRWRHHLPTEQTAKSLQRGRSLPDEGRRGRSPPDRCEHTAVQHAREAREGFSIRIDEHDGGGPRAARCVLDVSSATSGGVVVKNVAVSARNQYISNDAIRAELQAIADALDGALEFGISAPLAACAARRARALTTTTRTATGQRGANTPTRASSIAAQTIAPRGQYARLHARSLQVTPPCAFATSCTGTESRPDIVMTSVVIAVTSKSCT